MFIMLRSTLLALAITGWLHTSAAAGLIFQLMPPAYTPGDTFSFEVWLTGAQNLNSYNIDLVMTSSAGIAGTDFYFHSDTGSPPSMRPADSEDRYVFDESQYGIDPGDLFFAATASVSGAEARLNLSDAVLDFVTEVTTNSPYDKIATVWVTTTANAGVLNFSVDDSFLFLDDSFGAPIPNYGDFSGSNLPSEDVQLSDTGVIPEPSSLMIMGALLGTMGIARTIRARRRKSASSPAP
jgi:hypothetical protein